MSSYLARVCFALPPNFFPLTFTKDAPPARTTRELHFFFSTKFTDVTYKKGFKNCPSLISETRLSVNPELTLQRYCRKMAPNQWRRNRGGRGPPPPVIKLGGGGGGGGASPNPNPIIKYKSMRRSVALTCATTHARQYFTLVITTVTTLYHSTCVYLNSCSCCKYEVDSVISPSFQSIA